MAGLAAMVELMMPSVLAVLMGKTFGPALTDRVYDNHAHFIISEGGWEAVAEDCAAWTGAAAGAKDRG